MRAVAASLLAVALVGCVEPRDCALDTPPFDASVASDVRVRPELVIDAPSRWDARLPFNTGALCRTELIVAPTLAFGPTDFRTCLEADVMIRIRIVRASDGEVVFDRSGACGLGLLGPVAEGTYLMSVESGEYMVGARLIHADHCTDAGEDDPYCEPLSFTIRRCETSIIEPMLFCDPLAGDCPDVRWPWSS